MLLGNYSALNTNPGREVGSSYTNPYKWMKGGTLMNWFIGDRWDSTYTKKNALPTGTEQPYAFCMAIKGGELSASTTVGGDSEITAGLTKGGPIEASLSGSGTISAAAISIITQMAATLAGSGTAEAAMVGSVSLAATLAGSGDLEGALNIIASLNSALSGTGLVTANLNALAHLAANIYVNSGAATTAEIADAVWDELAADHDTAGTMGEKMNDAGSAGDPWNTDLGSYTTAGTAGKELKDKLSTVKFIALK